MHSYGFSPMCISGWLIQQLHWNNFSLLCIIWCSTKHPFWVISLPQRLHWCVISPTFVFRVLLLSSINSHVYFQTTFITENLGITCINRISLLYECFNIPYLADIRHMAQLVLNHFRSEPLRESGFITQKQIML